MPSLSIIVPCLDDPAALRECLERLGRRADCEVIVADASESDECRQLADARGARAHHCRRRGRGFQLNEGAGLASGSILIFTHADTRLHGQHLDAIIQAFANPEVNCATFYRDHRAHYPALKWFHGWARWWAKHVGIIYGDQSMVFRREQFLQLGRFPETPIMEDVEMSRRMRKCAGLVFLDPEIQTSMRWFHQRGFIRHKLRNILLIWLWRCGMKTETIYRIYYKDRRAASRDSS